MENKNRENVLAAESLKFPLSMNRRRVETRVGTWRCEVPARGPAGGIVVSGELMSTPHPGCLGDSASECGEEFPSGLPLLCLGGSRSRLMDQFGGVLDP